MDPRGGYTATRAGILLLRWSNGRGLAAPHLMTACRSIGGSLGAKSFHALSGMTSLLREGSALLLKDVEVAVQDVENVGSGSNVEAALQTDQKNSGQETWPISACPHAVRPLAPPFCRARRHTRRASFAHTYRWALALPIYPGPGGAPGLCGERPPRGPGRAGPASRPCLWLLGPRVPKA